VSKLRPLSPKEARNSLANRLGKTVDRVRQIDARLGNRPYQVFLVWSKWEGDERGDGNQRVICRHELEPTPVVSDLTALQKRPMSVGVTLDGSVRITEVSTSYTADVLAGQTIPEPVEDQVPQPYDFFYEIVEDGRHCNPAERKRFRLSTAPFLDAPNQQWILMLQKMSGDMGRDGKPQDVIPDPPKDVWETRQIEPPPNEEDSEDF
jgi:hypothetical protein